jgi:hypothetical protein
MIVQSDIVDILYLDCAQFGIDTYRKGNIPSGEVKKERIVIIPKKPSSETYWKKSFIEVNFCVPNLKNGKADLIRLAELEKIGNRALDKTSLYDSTRYSYSVESSSIEEDRDLKCHYVNFRVLFKVLNVKN